MLKKVFVFLFVIAVLFFAGCRPQSDEAAIRHAVNEFYLSYQNLDFETANEYCTPFAAEQLREIGEGLAANASNPMVQRAKTIRLEIKTITINRDATQATVQLYFHTRDKKYAAHDQIELQKLNGEWRICDF